MIRFTARFFPRWRADVEQRYLRRFELPIDRKVGGLSRGTRTKLALLLALCRGAELLILDGPTSGLDPDMTEEVLQALVGHVASEALTVFFSSHQLAEVEQIADRIAIVDRGRTVLSGALDDLRETFRDQPTRQVKGLRLSTTLVAGRTVRFVVKGGAHRRRSPRSSACCGGRRGNHRSPNSPCTHQNQGIGLPPAWRHRHRCGLRSAPVA